MTQLDRRLAVTLTSLFFSLQENLSAILNSRLRLTTTDYLSAASEGDLGDHFDLLLLGDMYFDHEISDAIDRISGSFLRRGKAVLVGDPGRWLLKSPSEGARLRNLAMVAKYELPEEVKRENSGLGGQGFVFRKEAEAEAA